MVLLRGAERSRRTAVACALVALSAWQALRPHPALSATASSLLRPVHGLFLRLAAELDAVFAEPPAADAVPRPAVTLAAVERALGQPPAVDGYRWLEAPVVEVDRSRAELLLAAGSDLGLEAGMVVAFGDHFLGRLQDVAARTARVRLLEGAAVRTGIRMEPAPGIRGYRAVALGRQAGDAPVVELFESDAWPREGHGVLWRPEPTEQAFDAARLRLGALEQEGDPDRGRAAWVVALERPAGAEGRVWIALPAAVEAPPVAAREVRGSAARRLLRADGVHGPGVPAVLLDAPLAGAVVTGDGRVAGESLAARGRVLWLRRRTPAAWGAAAVAVVDGARVMPGTEVPAAGAQLYTRGDARIPRGLWLGPPAAAPAPLDDPLVASAWAPLEP